MAKKTMLDAAEAETQQETTRVVPQGSAGRPYCDKHNALMRAVNTTGSVTYYKCQVPGCENKEKRARETAPVPAKPLICTAPSCRDTPVYREVNEKYSSIGELAMDCPKCGDRLRVARPTYDFGRAKKRREVELPAGFDER